MLSWFVRIGGVVFGEVTDQYTSQQTGNDSEEETDAKTGNFDQNKGSNDYQNRADICTFSQRAKQFLLICAFFCLNKEGTDNGSEDTQSTQSHWDHHTLEAKASGNAQSHGGKSCTCIGFIQVSTHTSNVTYVVAYVVSDNCRVSRVVFWDTSFNFTNQVSTNVSSFGEDTAAYTSKQSHGGSTHTKGNQSGSDCLCVVTVNHFQNVEPDGSIQQAQTNYGKAHYGTSGECYLQTFVQAVVSCVSSSCVSSSSNLHAAVAGQRGEYTACYECNRNKSVYLTKCSQDSEDDYQNNEYNSYALVLSFQVSISTGADFLGQGLHQVSTLVLTHDFLCLENSKQ